ncbi:hypothetical protein QH494_16115 [Sphingomonas sp. AR_OL41]|uniref:hypothetical protein n=1 Tax=Sphingomonas sp. AR_OL41 TaxID=3042729 RepID=UPI002480654B|nr:hypothetical protein [Sphingomonas sp. AR_OL41]MDH7973718.1 hypothetical protein [Sphingomonas sp. AR_OL41]
MSDEYVFATPLMKTIDQGVHVQEPEGSLIPVSPGKFGAVSVGAGQISGGGSAVFVAIHDRDGRTLLATLGPAAFNTMAMLMNVSARSIKESDFAQPETKQ